MHGHALQRLRRRAREASLDGLLLVGPVNLQYLTGFHSNACMVISIEPGVCIAGTGGVLWADNYVVTEAGVERLTSYPVLVEEA